MGKIWVDVLFGSKDNHRIESLEFEVVDLESPYHALLGRLALAKFMATTHMAYLKMKMPGPPSVDEPCGGNLGFSGHWILTNVFVTQADILASASSTPAFAVALIAHNYGT